MKKSQVSVVFTNLEHDVLVLKGSSLEAAQVLLEGKVCISTSEPLYVKKLQVKLSAVIKIQQLEGVNINLNKKLYEYTWNNLDVQINLNENSRNKSSNSLSKLSRPNLSISNSSSSILSKSSSNLSLSSSHSLIPGNYEVPFLAILPGNIPESVEGLPGAGVTYYVNVILEKGKLFQTTLMAKKKLRVIRTLTPDSMELSESVAVDNTWPNKVEYSINVPTKAISIGSSIPLSFMLVPLTKGLKLEKINIELVEHYSYVGYVPPTYSNERIVANKIIDLKAKEFIDKWEYNYHLQIPSNLSKVSQDCDIENHLKIRHKLKFVIGLINPGGHVSELRVSLPLQLFISPFVHIVSNLDQDEETLFTGINDKNVDNSFQGLVAPPVYERHIYDRLWQDVTSVGASPVGSPIGSTGSMTPAEFEANGDSGDVNNLFSMLAIDSNQLAQRLGQLNNQLGNISISNGGVNSSSANSSGAVTPATPKRATFNFSDDQDYFVSDHLPTPGILSPPTHLSRVNSTENLSQVPDYDEPSSASNDISPPYVPPLPGSQINLAELNRRFEESNSNRNKPFLSKNPSSTNLSLLSSNASSSPSSSRNQSSVSLALPSEASLSRSSSKRNINSIIPSGISSLPSTSPKANHYLEPQQVSAAIVRPSSRASDRAANAPPIRTSSSLSLHNLSFLNKKKHDKPK